MLDIYKMGAIKKVAQAVSRGKLARILSASKTSRLVRHWFETYYEERAGAPGQRIIIPRKLTFAILVWALHLTPGYALNLSEEVIEELHLKPDVLKKHLKDLGCAVQEVEDKHEKGRVS